MMHFIVLKSWCIKSRKITSIFLSTLEVLIKYLYPLYISNFFHLTLFSNGRFSHFYRYIHYECYIHYNCYVHNIIFIIFQFNFIILYFNFVIFQFNFIILYFNFILFNLILTRCAMASMIVLSLFISADKELLFT